MLTVSIDEAKTNLLQLIERAVQGEPFLIVKEGKPLVKVVPLSVPTGKEIKRTGFLSGEIFVPDDFDRMSYWEGITD